MKTVLARLHDGYVNYFSLPVQLAAFLFLSILNSFGVKTDSLTLKQCLPLIKKHENVVKNWLRSNDVM